MDIWNDIVSIIISNGVFAVLFVCLFYYQLRDSRTREEKYQQTIKSLTNHLGILQDVKEDLDEIKTDLKKQTRAEKSCHVLEDEIV